MITDAELVERVARAIFASAQEKAHRVEPNAPLPRYDDDDEDTRRFCLRMARAAIEALTATAPPSDACDCCQGNGEVVTDWDRYLEPEPNDIGEDVRECPSCGGSGFSGYGSGYGDVCSECGGQKQIPTDTDTKGGEA
jgi:hypothetical protein